jgi:NAD(P)-dependent dehydrogenase (short-subunit alcohol dehydrogenase family)
MRLVLMKLENKVAVITGAGGGIGAEIARTFAREGAHVVVADINLESARKVSDEVKKLNRNDKGFAMKVDVSKEAEVERMAKQTVEKLGHIDILVNSHGILRVSPLVDMSEEDWDAIMDTNAKGTFLSCKHVAREMIKRKSGRIINLASILAKRASKLHAHYSASKFAVSAITQTLAQELAPYNIRVNEVCPGDVDTEMFKTSCRGIAKTLGITFEEYRKMALGNNLIGRFQYPEDVAPLVLFLASEDSDCITGTSVDVSGGILYPPRR